MAGITATITAVGGLAAAYAGVKTAEATEKGMQQQYEMAKEQQDTQAKEIKRAQEESLATRKAQIDTQRKQMLGAGDTAYGINQTSDTGIGSGSLTGVLG